MLIPAPFQKQNGKVLDNKKDAIIQNKSNSHIENITYLSYNIPHSSSIQSYNQVSQKPFHSNIHFNFSNIQTKLKVSQPGDIYEQEADRFADYIMRKSSSEESLSSINKSDNLKINRKQSGNLVGWK